MRQEAALAPPGLHAHSHELDAVFDTSAIRNIGELPMHEFRVLRRLAKRTNLRSGWLEESFGEVLVTNLKRKGGCSDAAIRQLQIAVSRFDQLVGGSICPGVNTLVRRCIYRLARQSAPDPDPDDHGVLWRKIIDGFLLLRAASQLRFGPEGTMYSEFRIRNSGGMCRVNVPMHFVAHVEEKVSNWRERLYTEGRPNALQSVAVIMEDWEKWAVATGDQLSIPRRTVMDAFSVEIEGKRTRRPPEEVLDTPFAWRVVPWNTYLAKRVSGEKRRVEENDGRDIALSTYLSIAGRLVTDDGDLLKLLREVVGDPRRVVSLSEFRDLLKADSMHAPGES